MATTELQKKASRKFYINHKQKFKDYQREYKRRIRIEAINLYGGKCTCCGETQKEFLVFDHINGGGCKDWRRGTRGNGWYNHLIKIHPEDIQILCHNCNAAKYYYGQCPHKQEVENIYFDSSMKNGFKFKMEKKI